MMRIYHEVTYMAVREIKFHKTETTESNERNRRHASATFCRAYPRIQGYSRFKEAWGGRHLFHGALTGGSFISVMFSLILLLLYNY